MRLPVEYRQTPYGELPSYLELVRLGTGQLPDDWIVCEVCEATWRPGLAAAHHHPCVASAYEEAKAEAQKRIADLEAEVARWKKRAAPIEGHEYLLDHGWEHLVGRGYIHPARHGREIHSQREALWAEKRLEARAEDLQVLVPYLHKGESQSAPGPWWRPVMADRGRSATVCCPRCGWRFGIDKHRISETGVVEPSVACPERGCTWVGYLTLRAWNRVTKGLGEAQEGSA